MQFSEAAAVVSGIPQPHIPASRGALLYRHLRRQRPTRVLELGTGRGGSAVFIAAALEANGQGHLTTVDSSRYEWRDPSPADVLQSAGLAHRVTLERTSSTYTWFLKERLEAAMDEAGAVRPQWGFVFLDGSKQWSTDGLAVLLIEKLLRPGGWLLMDDLGWSFDTYAKESRLRTHYEVDIDALSETERTQPQLRAVYELLVRRNPAFTNCRLEDDEWWGWAQKVRPPKPPPTVRQQLRRRLRRVRSGFVRRPAGSSTTG